MSVLRTIEQKIEGLVERSFRRAFRSSLQPVELARRLAREMDEHKTISVSKVYVPNEYTVYLSEADRGAFSSFETSLTTELATYLGDHARGEGLSLLSRPVVTLVTDTDLQPGEFGIACRMVDPPEPAEEPEAERSEAPQEQPQPQPPPAPAPPPPPSRVYEPLAGVSGTQILTADQARAAGLVRESLTLVIDGSRHRVSKRIATIGRSRECDLVLADPNVSRTHAEIRHVGLDYFLIDKGSTNGMEVNGQRVKRHALADGDVITMGTTMIRVEKSA
jgi:predicted component of type VI protein secretion system